MSEVAGPGIHRSPLTAKCLQIQVDENSPLLKSESVVLARRRYRRSRPATPKAGPRPHVLIGKFSVERSPLTPLHDCYRKPRLRVAMRFTISVLPQIRYC